MMIRILELIALLGEAASDEIKRFLNSRIKVSVNAMPHMNYERRTSGKGDNVSFVILLRFSSVEGN